jgi:hypothetical protein
MRSATAIVRSATAVVCSSSRARRREMAFIWAYPPCRTRFDERLIPAAGPWVRDRHRTRTCARRVVCPVLHDAPAFRYVVRCSFASRILPGPQLQPGEQTCRVLAAMAAAMRLRSCNHSSSSRPIVMRAVGLPASSRIAPVSPLCGFTNRIVAENERLSRICPARVSSRCSLRVMAFIVVVLRIPLSGAALVSLAMPVP